MNVECLRGLKTAACVLAATVLVLVLTSCGSGGGDEPQPLKEGDRLTIGDTVETETGTVTIRSYEVLETAEHDEVQPPDGISFVVIEMEGCADSGRDGVVTIYATDVHLHLTDGSGLPPTRSAKEPALQLITNVQPGGCARGFLTYGVPDGSDPDSVTYEANPRADMAEARGIVTLRWATP